MYTIHLFERHIQVITIMIFNFYALSLLSVSLDGMETSEDTHTVIHMDNYVALVQCGQFTEGNLSFADSVAAAIVGPVKDLSGRVASHMIIGPDKTGGKVQCRSADSRGKAILLQQLLHASSLTVILAPDMQDWFCAVGKGRSLQPLQLIFKQ
ncbi:MAG: hypothetical protein BWY83_02049 [bacterium ADurb.Bin478]|nr:MAG: hypothetical protein BWY83_02049 [bacterium ADurb.Bin478]